MFHALLISGFLAELPTPDAATEAKYRQVVASAVKFLDGKGAELEKGSTCINCHHAPLRRWAELEASRLGTEIDVKTLAATTDSQLQKLLELKDDYRGKQWGHSLSAFFVLSEAGDPRQPLPDASRTELLKTILAEQGSDGSWKAAQQFGNQRRPKKDADEVQTLWSVMALTRLASQEGAAQSRERALEYLSKVEPGTTIDSRVLRLVVEQQLGKPERAAQLTDQLLEQQHADGGWGWQPDDPSEAWPVGLALFALAQLGDKAPAASIEKAQAFLATTQKDDGSWLVEGKLTKNSNMSSYFGTCWAVIGLSRTLPNSDLAAK